MESVGTSAPNDAKSNSTRARLTSGIEKSRFATARPRLALSGAGSRLRRVSTRRRIASFLCRRSTGADHRRAASRPAIADGGPPPYTPRAVREIGEAMKITKAVIPAAGLGTRFLPATKAQPKEMLPIIDKPTIQY